MTPQDKPFTDQTLFQVWIGARVFEGRVVDSYYQLEARKGKSYRREGWRLLLAYDVNLGEIKMVEKYYDVLRRIKK